MAGVLGEYTELFLEESEDQIEELNANLLKLEKDQSDPATINDIFRAAHSLKSSAAFVGLYNLSDLAHKMENLLQSIRDGKLAVKLSLVNLLFQCFDLIKNVIVNVSQGKKVDTPYTDMIRRLEAYENDPEATKESQEKLESRARTVLAEQNQQSHSSHLELDGDDQKELEEMLRANGGNFWILKVGLKSDAPMKGLRYSLILQNLKPIGTIYRTNPNLEELEKGTEAAVLTILILSHKPQDELTKAANVDMVETLTIEEFHPNSQLGYTTESNAITSFQLDEEEKTGDAKITLKSIKVSSDKLDQLMNNVGELVITNSGFQKIYDDLLRTFGEDQLFNELKGRIDLINRISKELQSGIMNIRMVPISTVFRRFSRLVRDLSLETGKKVDLILNGESTELDKKVIDALGEPLLHLIRNSVDHGIESPEERKRIGKPELGIVELNAYQGGSNIMVEIRDDGKGLDVERIRLKAVEKGLVSETDAAALSENDVYQFIFAPGFSTAEKITDISGRGVGMNVVNNLIQEFKGKILIQSLKGQGTSFVLSFPQALAIIPSILIMMEEEVYAFPLSEVNETIKVNNEQITTLEGNEIINLRGEVLPIYRLNRILGLQDKTDREESPVVIVQFKGRKLGFMVDELVGKHETVIKSLEKNFKNIKGLTGASIMGDGTIIMVLDIPGLVEIASYLDETGRYINYHLETMKRISTIRTIETEEEMYIQKTSNPTNVYNHKLHEITTRERAKRKKTERKKEDDSRKIVAGKEDLHREGAGKTEGAFSVELKVSDDRLLPNGGKTAEPSAPSVSNTAVMDKTAPSSPKFGMEDKYRSHISELISDSVNTDEEKKRAEHIIEGFLEQKKQRMMSVSHSKDFTGNLTREQIKKIEAVVNTGMMNAGMVLSQILNRNVDLFIPEILMNDKEGLASEIRFSDDKFYGMKVRMNGDLNGNLLMMFSRENAKNLAKELLDTVSPGDNLDDDTKSVLSEISNIVCASVLNSISNKAKVSVMPAVPELVEGTFLEVLDAVKPERTKFLSMLTEFNHEGNNLLGVLLFLPDFDELMALIPKF
ncbi:P2 response regulator binding domain protein [Leptospira broomii serovar Hurstbridge str. 5399]|uniref:Chemotaxis protein CheA n=1 Tax=Leptospira broomii serovar Hurstbridge str. 5399 TaxID=1049789 RepID=T0GB42_9LEPT|nr:chemotaxis protein CheW [Leptospira broomii]EQA44039.1 P2 response regulator binding domain protein [Leptospira broomii serovar Hurstbridge str. 5399]